MPLVLTPPYPIAFSEAHAGFNALPFPSLHPQVLLLLPVPPLACLGMFLLPGIWGLGAGDPFLSLFLVLFLLQGGRLEGCDKVWGCYRLSQPPLCLALGQQNTFVTNPAGTGTWDEVPAGSLLVLTKFFKKSLNIGVKTVLWKAPINLGFRLNAPCLLEHPWTWWKLNLAYLFPSPSGICFYSPLTFTFY